MYSLLIDTHDKLVSFVLYKDGKTIDIKNIESNMRHSEIAMPSLIDILKTNNVDIKDIDELLVVIGPGSFTGVRIGVVIAKTIAYLLNKPIKPITSLDLKVFSNEIVVPGKYAIDEKNGYFVGNYNESGKLMDDIKYINKGELDENDLINVAKIDFNSIYSHSKAINSINPHLVNPIYVKQIEALK